MNFVTSLKSSKTVMIMIMIIILIKMAAPPDDYDDPDWSTPKPLPRTTRRFFDPSQAPCPPGSPQYQYFVQRFRAAVARQKEPMEHWLWFYGEFEDLVCAPGSYPKPYGQAAYLAFIENRLIPWIDPHSPAPTDTQILAEELRKAFDVDYVPKSRFVTYYRETSPEIGMNADALLAMLHHGMIQKNVLYDIAHHFKMNGWDDLPLAAHASIEELADSFAFYLGQPYYGKPLTLDAIVHQLNDRFCHLGYEPYVLPVDRPGGHRLLM
jgi:hypothetical protein